MDSSSRAGQVSSAQHTREAQETQFKGYSVEIGQSSGVNASDVPEVHIRRHRSIGQMVWDTATDLFSGQSVGTTKESRKLDAMVAYIKTGEAYGVDGESHVNASILKQRLSALDQVLKSPVASSEQKEAAVEAFVGALKDQGVDFYGRLVRGLCSQLSTIEDALRGEDKALLTPIKREIGRQMLDGDVKKVSEQQGSNTPEARLRFLKDYKKVSGDVGTAVGINEQIAILESAIQEQQASANTSGPFGGALSGASDAVAKLNNADFDAKFEAIQEKAAAYAEQTGGKEPVAGGAHDTFVMDMVSSLKELYQELLKELDSPGLERGGQREADVKATLNSLRNLAKNIVTTPPEAGSTLEGKDKGMVHSMVNVELREMGFARRHAAFLGSTNRAK